MSRRAVRTTIAITAVLVACALTTGAAIASASALPAQASVSVVATHGATAMERGPDAGKPKPKASDRPESGESGESGAPAGHSRGWWKRAYSAHGKPKVDAETAQGYLDDVAARSSVFPEQTDASTPAAAHDVLSPAGPDRRARATAALLVAWLQNASGAVTDDAVVPLASGDVAFHDLLSRAEEVILDADATRAELQAITRDLGRVRHAG